MKQHLTLIFLFASISLFAQQTKHAGSTTADTSNTVSFTLKFEETKMTCKDGYFMNGYIVNLGYEEAKKIDGKTIKVTGVFTIVKGLENQPKEYDEHGNILYQQGRLQDTKFINLPKIEILNE